MRPSAMSTALGTSCEWCSAAPVRASTPCAPPPAAGAGAGRAARPRRAARASRRRASRGRSRDVLHDLAARARPRPVRQDDRDADHEVAHRPEPVAERPGEVVEQALGERRVARRIEREPLSVRRERARGAPRAGCPPSTMQVRSPGSCSRIAQKRSCKPGLLERVHPVGPRHLAAQARRREELARVREPERVERLRSRCIDGEVVLAEHQRHRACLVGADAVLAGDRAAGVDADLQDLLSTTPRRAPPRPRRGSS